MKRMVFTATEWMRNLRAVLHPLPPTPTVAETLRSTAEFYDVLSNTRHAEAGELFDRAFATRDWGERYSLYCRAIAMEHRAEAYHRLAGDVRADVSDLIAEADDYDRRAGLPQPVASVVEPSEAAHA